MTAHRAVGRVVLIVIDCFCRLAACHADSDGSSGLGLRMVTKMVGEGGSAVSSEGEKEIRPMGGGKLVSPSSSTSSMGVATTASSPSLGNSDRLASSSEVEQDDGVGKGPTVSREAVDDPVLESSGDGSCEIVSSPAVCDLASICPFLEHEAFEVKFPHGPQLVRLSRKGQANVIRRVEEFFSSSGGDVKKASEDRIRKVARLMVDEVLEARVQKANESLGSRQSTGVEDEIAGQLLGVASTVGDKFVGGGRDVSDYRCSSRRSLLGSAEEDEVVDGGAVSGAADILDVVIDVDERGSLRDRRDTRERESSKKDRGIFPEMVSYLLGLSYSGGEWVMTHGCFLCLD